MNSLELDALIEDYLQGKLSDTEKELFEKLRASDASIDHKVITHKSFLEAIHQYASTSSLKSKMNNAHDQINVAQLVAKYKPHPVLIVKLWRKNKVMFAAAASFVVLILLSLYSIKQTSSQTSSYEKMSKEVKSIRNSHNNLIRNVNNNSKSVNPGKFGGTGFSLSSNGYILTSYHVVENADSVYVQNNKGNSYKVKVVYTDPEHDLAVLKISDSSFENLKSLPYSINQKGVNMGEFVYTLGYPKDDAVYGEGYVSSKSGFDSDSTEYQVAIAVNPGNSGGPLMDKNGNIIGVINAKESHADGAAFARKSKYILEAINSIPQDSLSRKISFTKTNKLKGVGISKQIEKIQDFVFMVKVYN
ncbi:MAG: serine protease [Sphingobacteriaceae bacterium]|nr:serine protease [Sphingobacteriaceae bacterium]